MSRDADAIARAASRSPATDDAASLDALPYRR
jgi:hypothetical protein